MKIEKRNLKDLISPNYNPRTITPEAMESLKQSLKEFGYIDYLIVNEVNNHIVGGNQRAEAMKQLGYSEIDVILIHEPDIDREKMINIRLNNSSGEWDTGQLQAILDDLELKELDVTLTGFNIDTLKIQDINQSIPQSETITTDLNTGLKTETTERGGAVEEPVAENIVIPDDEPEFDETIADDIETITCPRCGYELPKH